MPTARWSGHRAAWVPEGDRQTLALVLLAAIASRVLWAVLVPTRMSSDSSTYTVLAHQILHLDFRGYTGGRTPGYPLLLILAVSNLRVVAWLQGALGVATTGLVYVTARLCSPHRWVAVVSALVFGCSITPMIYEGTILSESLATFLVALLVTEVAGAPRLAAPSAQRRRWSWAVGITIGCAAITRPALAGLVLPVLVFVWWAIRRDAREGATVRDSGRLGLWVALIAPLLLGYGGWTLFNVVEIGYAGVTTSQSISLANATCTFAQRAPKRYDDILRVYLPYRDRALAASGDCSGAMVASFGAIRSATGLSDVDLYKRLTAMDTALVVQNPGTYARVVIRHLADEWHQSVPADDLRPRAPLRGGLFSVVHKANNVAARLVFYGFLVASVALVVRSVRRARPPHPALLVAAAATLLISVVNVMVESSDVVRYLVPFIPVILVVVVEAFGWAIDLLTDGRRDVRTGRHAVGP